MAGANIFWHYCRIRAPVCGGSNLPLVSQPWRPSPSPVSALKTLTSTQVTVTGVPTLRIKQRKHFNFLSLSQQASVSRHLELVKKASAYAREHLPSFSTETGKEEAETIILAAAEDRYDGLIIDPDSLPTDVPTFTARLSASIQSWKSAGKRGLWLKLPIEQAALVPAAVDQGFTFHHAEPGWLMLTRWLPDDVASSLPANASHHVGVGAFVMNDRNEVLVVQEKNGILRGQNVWKCPTGLLNQGEDIMDAAVREVKEETGVDTQFRAIITLREMHGTHFGKSDLFCFCVLRPLSFAIAKQDAEIVAAQWMPFEDFKGQPFFKDHATFDRLMDLCVSYMEGKHSGIELMVEAGTADRKQTIYSAPWKPSL